MKVPKKDNIFDYRQHKICVDTVKNPLKALIFGGISAEQAENTLRDKFKYSDKDVLKLKQG